MRALYLLLSLLLHPHSQPTPAPTPAPTPEPTLHPWVPPNSPASHAIAALDRWLADEAGTGGHRRRRRRRRRHWWSAPGAWKHPDIRVLCHPQYGRGVVLNSTSTSTSSSASSSTSASASTYSRVLSLPRSSILSLEAYSSSFGPPDTSKQRLLALLARIGAVRGSRLGAPNVALAVLLL